MSRKGNIENYNYVEESIIRRACRGDRKAWEIIISRYDHYARKCLVEMGAGLFGLDMSNFPEDVLMQDVWMRVIKVMEEKFE